MNIGEFDGRHNLREEGKKQTWTTVRGCPDCDQICANYGLDVLREERDEIYRWRKELSALYARIQKLQEKAPGIRAEMNRLPQGLGLPSFNAEPDGVGFILGTGNVADFTIRGRPMLDSGTYVEYKVGSATYYVVLNASEQILAHYDGTGGWHMSGFGSRMIQEVDEQIKARVRAGFDFKSQAPTTDIVIAFRSGSASHHHFVIDDQGNVIIDEWRER